jgi:hypothetical protein
LATVHDLDAPDEWLARLGRPRSRSIRERRPSGLTLGHLMPSPHPLVNAPASPAPGNRPGTRRAPPRGAFVPKPHTAGPPGLIVSLSLSNVRARKTKNQVRRAITRSRFLDVENSPNILAHGTRHTAEKRTGGHRMVSRGAGERREPVEIQRVLKIMQLNDDALYAVTPGRPRF